MGSFEGQVYQPAMRTTSLPKPDMQPTSTHIPVSDTRRKSKYRNRERGLYRELAALLVKPDVQGSVSRAQLLELAISTIRHYRSRSGSFWPLNCPNTILFLD